MPHFKRLIPVLIIALLLVLGTGFMLAYEPAEVLETESANAVLGSWPIMRHDNGRSGYNADVGSFRPPLAYRDTIDLQGQENTLGQIFNIVTGPKRIYAQAQSDIWGVNKEDLSDQWKNADCNPDPVTFDFCTYVFMAYSSDRLIVVRQNFFFSIFDIGFELIVLNAASGEEIWSRHLGETAPEIALEGTRILVLTEEGSTGKLTKLRLDGSLVFEKEVDIEGSADGVVPVGAVINSGRFIYANGDRILAYSTANGELSWIYTPTLQISTYGYDLVATADAVIVSQDERVIKLDITDGTFLWETDVKPAICNSDLGPNGAATDGNTIAVTAVCDREVVALNYATGAEKWRKDLEQVPTAAAVAMGGDVLYVASATGINFNIFALDPDNGTELEKLARDPVESSSVLVISDGLLLTASNVGNEGLQRFERLPADLSAFLSPAGLPICGASVGGTLTFNFRVSNFGPGTTDNTRADLTLPDGTTILSASQGSCTGGSSPFCELGALSVGQDVYITATVTLDKAGSYSPGISLSGPVRDPEDSNDSDSQPLTVMPAAPSGLDLQVTDIEITQGIQNLANEVPLVEGKTTFVRVYGQTDGDPITNVSAVLHGEVVGSGENLGTLNPIQAASCLALDGDTPNRDQLSESFVFELPENWWQGNVKFTAEINPGGIIAEDDTANNTLSVTRRYTKLPRVCLMTYPVRTTGTRPGDSDETDNLFPSYMSIANDTGNILSRALTMLPVREIKVYPSSHLIEEWEPFSDGGYGPYEMDEDEDNRGDVLDTLWWLNLFTDDPDACDADDSLTHYIGMVDQNTENTVGSAGLGIRDGDEAMLFLNTGPNGPQAFDDPHGGLTLAHEVGHNYDRGHVNCGNPKNPDENYPKDRNRCNFAPIDPRSYFGLEFRDPTTPTVITPTMAGDLMSYAGDVWPSEYTWEAIQEKLCDANGCTFPSLSLAISPKISSLEPASNTSIEAITGDVLVVRGWITDTIAIQDIYRLPVEQVPKADEMWAEQVASRPLTPTYALNLISGTTILHSEPFTLTHSDDQETSRSSFGLLVPWDPNATGIEFTIDDAVVNSLSVSSAAPVINTLSPNGGENFTDALPISWSASDLDGDELRYTVLYSGDNGASWQVLAAGVQTTTHIADSTLLPGSAGQSLVKIMATDGLNFASRQSAAGFTLPDRTPHALIYFPDDGGQYTSGSSLTLRGAVYDPEDGYLPAEEMSWTLSGQGSLGTGDNIVLDDLEDGKYMLTLMATDSNEHTGSKTISFRIGEKNEVYLPTILKP